MSKKAVVQDWHPADITAALKKRGLSCRQLSLHHGYGPSTLHSALHRPWPKAEQLIAEAIGTTPAKIWPSRYEPKKSVAEVLGEVRRELQSASQFSAVIGSDKTVMAVSTVAA